MFNDDEEQSNEQLPINSKVFEIEDKSISNANGQEMQVQFDCSSPKQDDEYGDGPQRKKRIRFKSRLHMLEEDSNGGNIRKLDLDTNPDV